MYYENKQQALDKVACTLSKKRVKITTSRKPKLSMCKI